MSIQRYTTEDPMFTIEEPSKYVDFPKDAEFVTYEAHLAEVERSRKEGVLAAVRELTSLRSEDWQRSLDEERANGAEAMRAAIYDDIAENVGRRGDVNAEIVLAHIKEVQP